MIFVTVGNMDPFDRLIKAIDGWLAENSHFDVFAQIGAGKYHPRHCPFETFLTPEAYRQRFENAELIVAHAGMGTIITALELNKPIVIMPKRAELGEQRNNHQIATVQHFRRSPRILIAESEAELPAVLHKAVGRQDSPTVASGSANWNVDPELISFVRSFVSLQV